MIVSICVVSKEYRWVQVESQNQQDAVETAWKNIESILNRKAVDYDTELYVDEGVEEGWRLDSSVNVELEPR